MSILATLILDLQHIILGIGAIILLNLLAFSLAQSITFGRLCACAKFARQQQRGKLRQIREQETRN
jgi:hypothetical protein